MLNLAVGHLTMLEFLLPPSHSPKQLFTMTTSLDNVRQSRQNHHLDMICMVLNDTMYKG